MPPGVPLAAAASVRVSGIPKSATDTRATAPPTAPDQARNERRDIPCASSSALGSDVAVSVLNFGLQPRNYSCDNSAIARSEECETIVLADFESDQLVSEGRLPLARETEIIFKIDLREIQPEACNCIQFADRSAGREFQHTSLAKFLPYSTTSCYVSVSPSRASRECEKFTRSKRASGHPSAKTADHSWIAGSARQRMPLRNPPSCPSRARASASAARVH